MSFNYEFIINCSIILILLIIISLLLIHYYLRLTCGICKSKRDLSGKTVVITGGNTGIGKEVVRDLALRNAKIILGVRTVERGYKAINDIMSSTGNYNISVLKCDLSSLKSVKNFCDQILESEHRIDILICFAGSGAPFGRHLTEDGIELQFATNHLGHFLLVNALVDRLKSSSPSRVIITSSLAHRFGKLDLSNMIRFDKYSPHPYLTYCNTKLANVMFMKELSERLKGSGICVNALHPGTIYTNGIRFNSIWYLKIFLMFLCALYNKTLKEGAQTIIYLAVSEEVEGVTGQYFVDCKLDSYNPLVDDKILRKKLWNVSQKLCETVINYKSIGNMSL